MRNLATLLENLSDACMISEEIIKRGGMYLVIPKPKHLNGRKVYKKTKAGRLWTMGRYKTREKAKARLSQVETFKHLKYSKDGQKGRRRGLNIKGRQKSK